MNALVVFVSIIGGGFLGMLAGMSLALFHKLEQESAKESQRVYLLCPCACEDCECEDCSESGEYSGDAE